MNPVLESNYVKYCVMISWIIVLKFEGLCDYSQNTFAVHYEILTLYICVSVCIYVHAYTHTCLV